MYECIFQRRIAKIFIIYKTLSAQTDILYRQIHKLFADKNKLLFEKLFLIEDTGRFFPVNMMRLAADLLK